MKIRKFLLPIFALCSFLVIPFAEKVSPLKTNATFLEEAEFSEDFDKKSLDTGNWELNNAKFNIERYSMRMNPSKYQWGSIVQLQNTYITEDFIFDVDMATFATKSTGGHWMGIAFGMKTKTATFADAQFAFIFYSSYFCDQNGAYCDREEADTLKSYPQNLYATPFMQYGVETKTRFHVTLVNDNKSLIYYDILDKDENIIKEHGEQDVFTVNRSLAGYVGFNNSSVTAEITNISIRKAINNDILYEDDFTASSVQYPTSGSGVWRTVDFTSDDVVIGPVSNVQLLDDNSSIIYKTPIKNSCYERVDVAYTSSVSISYITMSTNAVAGFEFAKSSINSNGYIAGIKRERFGYKLVVYDSNRNEIVTKTSSDNAKNSCVNLTLEYKNRGIINLYTDEISVSFACSSFDGYIGIKNISIDGEACSGPVVDNFSLNKMIDKNDNAPDVSINFNGIKETQNGAKTSKSFFLPTRDWIQTNKKQITLSRFNSSVDKNNPNGYLCFNRASEGAAFGSRTKYRDFVCKFDITILSNENYEEMCGFGLQFGVDNPKTLFENAQSLGLYNTNYTSPSSTMALGKRLILTEDGEDNIKFVNTEKTDEFIDFFKKRNGQSPTLNVVYVVFNGQASMYFKFDDEPESELYTPKIVAKANASTEGYVLVIGIGSVSFNLDNFSVTNLDYLTRNDSYTSLGSNEYQITTRKDFTTSNDTSGLSLSNASYSNKAIRINNGGSISTVGKMMNGMFRANLKSVEEKTTFKFGNASISVIDDYEGKRIVGKDNNGQQVVKLADDFKFNGSNIEIEKSGMTFKVRFIDGNTPLSSMVNDPVVFTLDSGDKFNKLEILSDGITDISSLMFINYDNHQVIATRNYDPAIDDIDTWAERDSIQDLDKKKGCKGSILSSSLTLCIALCAICSLLIIRRKYANEEK